MTQNTGRSLPEIQLNVNGILRVYFETLSGYCGPPEIGIENPRWAPSTEKFGRDWRLKMGLNGLIGTRMARSAP